MRPRLLPSTLVSLLLVGLAAAPVASGKVFSSGDIDRRLPDLGRVASTIKVPNRAEIADISVKVRMSHGYTPDLLMGIELPDGDFEELISQGAAAGPSSEQRNLGAGSKDCKGDFTTFNDGAATAIEDGSPPFVGSYRPSNSLSAAGDRAKGAYRLIAFDTNQSDAGTLHCWKVDIDFAP